MTPLTLWCEHVSAFIVDLLLRKGASVNLADEHGSTPIYAAAQYNHPHLLPILHEAQANPNRTRVDGSTAILTAAEKGHEVVLEGLYNRGGDLNACLQCGATSLSLAVQNGHSNCVKKLLEWRCVANTVDGESACPLWIAASRGHQELIEPLFLACPDMALAEHSENQTNALEVALAMGHMETFLTLGALFLVEWRHKCHDPTMVAKLAIENLDQVGRGDEKLSYHKVFRHEERLIDVSKEPCPRGSPQAHQHISSAGARLQGNDFFKQKRFVDAVDAYERAMKLDPSCLLAPSNASEAALQLKDFSKALDYSRAAIKIDPKHTKS